MKKQFYIMISLLAMTWSLGFAQTATDAIRFSNNNFGGTARTIGLAGAYGALGGDFSALSINPAGLGVYRSNEFVMTFGYNDVKIDATLLGTEGANGELSQKFTMPNIGYISNATMGEGKWKVLNFGIGFNNTDRYNRRTFYEGTTKGSMSESFVELANGHSTEEFNTNFEGMGYEVYAIDNSVGDNTYDNLYNGDEDIYKSHFIVQKGYSSEIVLSVGANYDEKLLVGATLGLPIYRYEYDATYKEAYSANNNASYVNFKYDDYYKTTGHGKNFKIGAIYLPVKNLRLGLSAQTPTLIKLSDNYNSGMTNKFNNAPHPGSGNNNQEYSNNIENGEFDYKLRIPGSITGSFAYLFGKKGLISMDVETKNYSRARYIYENEYRDAEVSVNKEITNGYQRAYNIRTGGEIVLSNFRIRGGLAMYGSPFKDDSSFQKYVTGGVGYRGDKTYIDFAVKNRLVKEGYRPYELENEDLRQDVDITGSILDFNLTIGFKF